MAGAALAGLQTGVVYGGTALWSAVNGITPHLAGAVDIMVVEQPDGTLKSSPFYVRFGKYTPLRNKDRVVKLHVNGTLSSFCMHLGTYGHAYFAAETTELVSEEEDEAILAGMMSPPSGYSSGEEGAPPFSHHTTAVGPAVREEVQRLKDKEAHESHLQAVLAKNEPPLPPLVDALGGLLPAALLPMSSARLLQADLQPSVHTHVDSEEALSRASLPAGFSGRRSSSGGGGGGGGGAGPALRHAENGSGGSGGGGAFERSPPSPSFGRMSTAHCSFHSALGQLGGFGSDDEGGTDGGAAEDGSLLSARGGPLQHWTTAAQEMPPQDEEDEAVAAAAVEDLAASAPALLATSSGAQASTNETPPSAAGGVDRGHGSPAAACSPAGHRVTHGGGAGGALDADGASPGLAPPAAWWDGASSSAPRGETHRTMPKRRSSSRVVFGFPDNDGGQGGGSPADSRAGPAWTGAGAGPSASVEPTPFAAASGAHFDAPHAGSVSRPAPVAFPLSEATVAADTHTAASSSSRPEPVPIASSAAAAAHNSPLAAGSPGVSPVVSLLSSSLRGTPEPDGGLAAAAADSDCAPPADGCSPFAGARLVVLPAGGVEQPSNQPSTSAGGRASPQAGDSPRPAGSSTGDLLDGLRCLTSRPAQSPGVAPRVASAPEAVAAPGWAAGASLPLQLHASEGVSGVLSPPHAAPREGSAGGGAASVPLAVPPRHTLDAEMSGTSPMSPSAPLLLGSVGLPDGYDAEVEDNVMDGRRSCLSCTG